MCHRLKLFIHAVHSLLSTYFPDIEVEKIVMAESARSGVASIYSHDYYKYRRHMETVEKDKEEVRHLKTYF